MIDEIVLLHDRGVKETPNRILVLRTLMRSHSPLSFKDIEEELPTLDKSSIFRVLQHFVDHDIIHHIDGGDGIPRYEVCHGNTHCSVDDMHIHFYCTRCRRTFCFEQMPIPQVSLPDGYQVTSVNYMVKGLCPKCRNK